MQTLQPTYLCLVTRRASQRRLIVITTSAMWILSMLFFGSVWFGLDWCLVVNGDTREDISRCSSTKGAAIVQLLSQAPLVIIADGLLVRVIYVLYDIFSYFILFIGLAVFSRLGSLTSYHSIPVIFNFGGDWYVSIPST